MKRLLCIYLVIFITGCANPVHSVRDVKSDVPFTYKIGIWPYQDELSVSSLTVAAVDSKLNLFNSESILAIKLKGTMRGSNNGWKPYIREVHILEKVVKGSGPGHEAVIEVTPIIGTTRDKTYQKEILDYTINQELIVSAMGRGDNKYRIMSQDKQLEIVLYKSK